MTGAGQIRSADNPPSTSTIACPHCDGRGTVPAPATLGERLAWLREKCGKSIRQVTTGANIKFGVYWRNESGASDNPQSKFLVKIAKFFGVSVDQLLGFAPLDPSQTDITHLPGETQRRLTGADKVNRIKQTLAEQGIEPVLTFDNMALDMNTRTLTIGKAEPIYLSPTHATLMATMIAAAPKGPMMKETAFEALYGHLPEWDQPQTANAVNAHFTFLRQKLRQHGYHIAPAGKGGKSRGWLLEKD